MPLSLVIVDTVTPRGGRALTQVTIQGSGFGAAQGTVVLDPAGEAVTAAIVSWVPDQIVYTIPALSSVDRTVTVQVNISTGLDSGLHPFWYAGAIIPGQPPAKLDFQWPGAEAGSATQDDDDPRTWTAADFNRALALLLLSGRAAATRQEEFAGETAALGGGDVALSATLSALPLSVQATRLFLRRDAGGAGDTFGGLLMRPGTDYDVNVATGLLTWKSGAAVPLVPADIITVVYAEGGLL